MFPLIFPFSVSFHLKNTLVDLLPFIIVLPLPWILSYCCLLERSSKLCTISWPSLSVYHTVFANKSNLSLDCLNILVFLSPCSLYACFLTKFIELFHILDVYLLPRDKPAIWLLTQLGSFLFKVPLIGVMEVSEM